MQPIRAVGSTGFSVRDVVCLPEIETFDLNGRLVAPAPS